MSPKKVGSIFSRLTETQFLTRAIVDHYLAHDGHHLDGHDPAGHNRQGGGRHHDVYCCALSCTIVHHRALPCATSRTWILGGQFKGDARIREGPEHSLRQGRGKKVGQQRTTGLKPESSRNLKTEVAAGGELLLESERLVVQTAEGCRKAAEHLARYQHPA